MLSFQLYFPVSLHYLCDVPEHTEKVAKWIFETFPHEFEGTTLAEWTEWLEPARSPDKVTFVAVENGQVIGTASLDTEDLPPRSDLTPWLASVYVLPEFRARGLGANLVEAVEHEARTRGFDKLYLHTTDRADFYKKRGWQILDTVHYWNQAHIVMIKNLI
jgi:GNAT superfamily N-acetyltransferase